MPGCVDRLPKRALHASFTPSKDALSSFDRDRYLLVNADFAYRVIRAAPFIAFIAFIAFMPPPGFGGGL